VEPAEDNVKATLGNALYAAGVYFEMENPIRLRHDAAWSITLTGKLPNGSNGTNNSGAASHNPDTAMFAGEDCEFFIVGNACPLAFTKVDSEGNDQMYKLTDSQNWGSSCRLGQNRIQKLSVWNEYDEASGSWKIHWMSERIGATDDWDNSHCTSAAAAGVDFEFTSIGSAMNYFGANTYGNEVGKFKYAYLGEIEIWEDTKNVEKTSVESVPADMIGKSTDAFSEPASMSVRNAAPPLATPETTPSHFPFVAFISAMEFFDNTIAEKIIVHRSIAKNINILL
jgi:hypothetical protein